MEYLRKASTYILALSSVITLNTNASIVINEIDYDQPGSDLAEFIELYNSNESTSSLDDFTIELINGNNSLSYRTINLDDFSIASNDYFVICSDAMLVTNCDYSFTTSSSWFQNGAPDAIALYQSGNVIDSLSYEGILLPHTEGEALLIKDNNATDASLSRINDGIDTNNNLLDFELGCITPGSSNIAGSGNCSEMASAVPVPATVWLFGSGLIGIVGLARRK